jgi:diamine N-acetyltransferase
MRRAEGGCVIQIRRAAAADAAGLAVFAERTFRDAFEADNDPADMDLYCLQAFSEVLQAAEIADPAIDTWIMHDARDGLVAYAQLRDGVVPSAVTGPRPIELSRFYVDRAHHATGVAGALMSAVLNAARARKAQTLWLGVWERNVRAQAFYRKHHFVDVGAHTFLVGGDRQTDRLMSRPL